LLRRLLPLAIGLTTRRRHDLANTVIVAASPRSGTTWLAELLSLAPRSAILFEPEHQHHVAEARAAGISWHTCRTPHERWPEGEAFFDRALRGEIRTTWTLQHVPLARAFAPRTWIVKLVDCNLLLGWIAAHFATRPPILLLRHPCAVVASQMRLGWVVDRPPRLPSLLERYPHLAAPLAALRDPIEYAAALWSVQAAVPLTLSPPASRIVLTYERLVADPGQELATLFTRLGLPTPGGIAARAPAPSATAPLRPTRAIGRDPLMPWTDTLDHRQVERVLTVVRTFGLDFYDEGPEPNITRLTTPATFPTSRPE